MPTLYLTEQGSTLRSDGNRLTVESAGRTVFSTPVLQVERVLVFGNVQLTTQAIGMLLREGVEVSFLSFRGRLKGRLVAAASRNLALRLAQYARALDADFALQTAQAIVAGKIRNGRAVLGRYERNHSASTGGAIGEALHPLRRQLKHLAQSAGRQEDLPSLLGIEGQAAAVYFQGFAAMLRPPEMTFTTRTRHPPRDPVNALLSLGYTLAGNELHGVVTTLGFDPWLGFLHGVSERRPGLPMDLLEEFRAPLVDRFTLALLNRRVLDARDFAPHPKGGVTLTPAALRKYLLAWEKNLNRPFQCAFQAAIKPVVVSSEVASLAVASPPGPEQGPAPGLQRSTNQKSTIQRSKSPRTVSFRQLFALQARALAEAIERNKPYRPYAHR